MNLRIGSGFDLHRLKSGRPFVLGCVTLNWPAGPYGHSDGDPVSHALADALLGGSGLGDIGDNFPDNDPEWKNCSGRRILGLTIEKIGDAGFKIINADITVFLQKPHLKSKKLEIRERLSEVINISVDRISLKAKTTEGFGGTGRGDCVAVQATVLLQKEGKT